MPEALSCCFSSTGNNPDPLHSESISGKAQVVPGVPISPFNSTLLKVPTFCRDLNLFYVFLDLKRVQGVLGQPSGRLSGALWSRSERVRSACSSNTSSSPPSSASTMNRIGSCARHHAVSTRILGKTMRDAARNKERWKGSVRLPRILALVVTPKR